MALSLPNIISAFIFLVTAIEGLGILHGRAISYWLIIVLAPLFFIHMLFTKKRVVFPRTISVLLFLFFLSQLLSVIFSVNIASSLVLLFLTIASEILLICAYNYRKEMYQRMPTIIFALALLFIFYSTALNNGFQIFNIPETGYQFVYSRFGSHNHIGDFLMLPIIIATYYLYRKERIKNSLIAIIAFIPFVIVSFSRSSYFTLAISACIIHLIHMRKINVLRFKLLSRSLLLLIIFSALFLIIGTTSEASNHPLLRTFHTFFVNNENLQPKDLLGSRIEYLKEAFNAFGENPILGIGPNNFIEASNKYTANPYKAATQSPHNVFIEVLVGQGIIGFVLFLLLILFILKSSRKTSLFFVFLAMLINFQTDYTYQIYSFFLLFLIVAGLITNDKDIPVYKLRNYLYNKMQL